MIHRSFLYVAWIIVALVTGCERPDIVQPQILRVSQRNEPSVLDSAKATLPDEFSVLRAVSEGLLIPGLNGAPEPGVALRFDVSQDGLTYTFHLRPTAVWSDGSPVTAADFVASYRRALMPSTAANKPNVFYPVKNARAFSTGEIDDFSLVGFRVADAHTLVVTLERPTPRFPYYVVSVPWLPMPTHWVEAHGRNWTQPGNFVGNGPFTLVEWKPDQRIVVRKNPRWHGATNVGLHEIRFVRFDSNDTEERAYRAGQVDVTMGIPFSKIETYARDRPAELHRAPMLETRSFCFNTRRAPLDDVRVRRALALALDREKIVKHVVRGGQAAAARLIPTALRDSSVSLRDVEHHYDPVTARRLLSEAMMKSNVFPPLEITAWSPSQVPVLEAAQYMWRQELGLDFRIAIREARVHWHALEMGDFDIAYISAIPDVADIAEMLGDYLSGAPDNFARWSDRLFDDAVRRATSVVHSADRATAFLEAEHRLLQAAPLTPVYFNDKLWLMSARVRGWQEDGLWSQCYHNVYLAER